jgi:hypothetical protein
MLTPEKRAHLASIARLGGLATSSTTDGVARTARARSTFRESFANGHGCSRCPTRTIPTDLPATERARRSAAMYREHFSRLGRA